MKKIANRILLMLLSLALVVCIGVFSVSAAEEGYIPVEVEPISYVNPLEQNSEAVRQELPALGSSSGEPANSYTTFTTLAEALKDQVEARNTTVILGYKTAVENDQILVELVDEMFRHTGVPTEGDYIRWNMRSYDLHATGSHYDDDGMVCYHINCTFAYYANAYQEQQTDAAVKALLQGWDVKKASDYHKVCLVYDYMCQNITYDYAGLDRGDLLCHSTYSAAVLHNTVCQGYASLFYRLMLEMDVDTRLVAGIGNGGAHGWNIVELDGLYYNLDATWDAELTQYGYPREYFLRSDAAFPDHYRYEEYTTSAFYAEYPMAWSNYTYTPSGWYQVGTKWHYLKNGADVKGWLCVKGEWYLFNAYGEMLTGWQWIGGSTYYFDADGIMQTGWTRYNNKWYYLDASGAMVTGWKKIGGTWYYMDGNGAMQTGWIKVSGYWYYMSSSGAMATGWLREGNNYYYLNNDGVMQTGWVKSYGTWYYMNSSGVMVTGWLQQGSYWYYFDGSGAMATGTKVINGKANLFDANGVWKGEVAAGWNQQGGKWYYIASNGTTHTGWLYQGGRYYYFNSSGVMQTGWVRVDGLWYYFNSDGTMVTGWLKQGGTWYYMNSGGAMTTGWLKLDGNWYAFKDSGEMITGWATDGSYNYYFNSSGVMHTGWLYQNGKYYYFGTDGVQKAGWQHIDGNWYGFNSDGEMIVGWGTDGVYDYYFDSNGVMVTGRRKIGGVWYTFDSQGRLIG